MNEHAQSQMYLRDFVRRQRGAEWEGFIVLFLCAGEGMNLGGCLHTHGRACVCLNECRWEKKAALCIAVHHRQYPCFFGIHIHTPFSYSTAGKRVQMHLMVQQREIWVRRKNGSCTKVRVEANRNTLTGGPKRLVQIRLQFLHPDPETEMETRSVIGRVLLFCSEERMEKGARGYERTLIAMWG